MLSFSLAVGVARKAPEGGMRNGEDVEYVYGSRSYLISLPGIPGVWLRGLPY